MKIETKFSIGDKPWKMSWGVPKQIKITKIEITVDGKRACVEYAGVYPGNSNEYRGLYDSDLSETKQALMGKVFGVVTKQPDPILNTEMHLRKIVHDWIIHPLAWAIPAALWNPLHDWHRDIAFPYRGD